MQFVVLCQNSSCSPSSTSVFLVHMMNSSNSSFPLISSQGFPSSQWMSCCLCLPSSRNIMQVQTSPFANSLRCGQTRQHFARLAHVEKRWRSSCRSRDSQRSLRLIAKANDSTADDSLPSEMSLENALKLLGVREGASFDEILTAKKTMVDSCRGDQARITQVIFLTAYDFGLTVFVLYKLCCRLRVIFCIFIFIIWRGFQSPHGHQKIMLSKFAILLLLFLSPSSWLIGCFTFSLCIPPLFLWSSFSFRFC